VNEKIREKMKSKKKEEEVKRQRRKREIQEERSKGEVREKMLSAVLKIEIEDEASVNKSFTNIKTEREEPL
jgi:hypothetical protein